MKKWPLYLKDPVKIPQKGESGAFWEERGDRYHCGVDLYTPENTEVLSTEEGIVSEH